MSRSDVLTTLGSFVVAVGILSGLFWVVGASRILDALAGADPQLLTLVLLAGLGWLTAWSLSLWTVMGALGVDCSLRRAWLTYASAAFLNNITPFGQAGGEPLAAILIAGSSEAEYETGLAAIAGVDTLNFVPSILFALLGASYYTATVTTGQRIELATVAVVVTAVTVPAVLYSLWRQRTAVGHWLAGIVTPAGAVAARVVPPLEGPDRARVESFVAGFFQAIERIGADRRRVAVALGFSTVGWLLQAVAMVLAFEALGAPISIAVALFVIPVAAIAGVTPLPGGLGGIETALIGLLIPTTGVSAAVVTAAVIIHRGVIYWMPILLGGPALAARSGSSLTQLCAP